MSTTDDLTELDDTEQNRELLEEIASWDDGQYPIAKHARRILHNLDERGEDQ